MLPNSGTGAIRRCSGEPKSNINIVSPRFTLSLYLRVSSAIIKHTDPLDVRTLLSLWLPVVDAGVGLRIGSKESSISTTVVVAYRVSTADSLAIILDEAVVAFPGKASHK